MKENQAPLGRNHGKEEQKDKSIRLLSLNGIPSTYSNIAPYIFDIENQKSNIKFKKYKPIQEEFLLEYASKEKIIEWVTHEKYNNLNLRTSFLFTYRIFSTSIEVLDLLKQRFLLPTPPNMTASELNNFSVIQQKKIQIKVLSIMKNWVDEHFYDLLADSSTLNNFEFTLMNFIMFDQSSWISDFIKHVQNTIAFKQNLLNDQNRRKSIWNKKILNSFNIKGDNKQASLHVQKYYETKNIFGIPIDDIAQQLALINFQNFSRIIPTELLNKNWESKQKYEKSPNVVNIINRTNLFSLWISFMIMHNYKNEKELISRVCYFIDLMEKLEEINDLCGMFDVFNGLRTLQIRRLKEQIWERLSKKRTEKIKKIQDFFYSSQSMIAVKKELRLKSTPCVPHISFYTADMFNFTEEYNRKQSKMKKKVSDIVHFGLCVKMAERLSSIKKYQHVNFNFPINIELVKILSNMPNISENEVDDMSYSIRPSAIDLSEI